MKWKKRTAVLLSLIVIISTITGCSKHSGDKKVKETVAMGRYVEESITMPDAVVAQDEIIYIMLMNPKGQIEIYGSALKAKAGSKIVQYTLGDDKKWERTLPKWLNDREDINELETLTYGPDGALYAVASKLKKDSIRVHIIKTTDGNNSEDIAIDEYKEDVDYNKRPMNLTILDDGAVLMGFYNECIAYKNGKRISNFEIGEYQFAVSGNEVISRNKNSDSAVITSINTGKVVSEVPFGETLYDVTFSADKDGNWYMVSKKGIWHLVKGGSSWEVVLDGALESMSMPEYSFNEIISGKSDDFYIMYESGNGLREVKYYSYNKDLPSAPSKTLSIVSLRENFTVRQLIVDFQHQNPDIKVDYRTYVSGNNDVTDVIVSDLIKTINTELLAGEGPDIIVLDGMPVNSYIEKGVLEDLSDIINPMMNEGQLVDNIITPYQQDGKIYTAPLRFAMSYTFGTKDAVKATGSMQNLVEYASKCEVPLFGEMGYDYKELATKCFNYYSDSFFSQKDGFDKDGLILFLENLKKLCDQSKVINEYDKGEFYGRYSEITSGLMYENKANLGFAQVYDPYDIYFPIFAVDKIGGIATTVNGKYTPSGLIGLNKASKQKDIAKEFIKALFEEPVQEVEIGDGFPVNAKALETYGLEYDDVIMGEIDGIEITQPSKEKLQELLQLSKTLTTPITLDKVFLDMVLTDTIAYLNGEMDAEKAADAIINKTGAYLSE